MEVERIRPTVFRLTLHTYELTALVAAARWAAGGGQGEISEEAVHHLKEVLKGYDAEMARLASPSRNDGGPGRST